MSVSRIRAFPSAYRDSLLLLNATRTMQDSDDVSWASAAMATPADGPSLGTAPPGTWICRSVLANRETSTARSVAWLRR